MASEDRTTQDQESAPDMSRRKALEKIIKTTAYTAPTAALLLAGVRDAKAGNGISPVEKEPT